MNRRRTTRTLPTITQEQILAHQTALWTGPTPIHEGFRWRDNAKCCRTCTYFGREDLAGRIWCAVEPAQRAVHQPLWGCAHWMREPGADGDGAEDNVRRNIYDQAITSVSNGASAAD